jgi:hypothetical protein
LLLELQGKEEVEVAATVIPILTAVVAAAVEEGAVTEVVSMSKSLARNGRTCGKAVITMALL